jgi:hypothetical protein
MTEVNDDEALDLARAIARGEDPVRRIITMRWFTYDVEGEDVVVTDELKAKIEALGGSNLVEVKPEGYAGERVLRFENVEAAKQRLFNAFPQG